MLFRKVENFWLVYPADFNYVIEKSGNYSAIRQVTPSSSNLAIRLIPACFAKVRSAANATFNIVTLTRTREEKQTGTDVRLSKI